MVTVLVVLGLLLLGAPLLDDALRDRGLLLPVLGVFLLGVAYAVAQVRVVRPDGRARTSLDHGRDGSALVVALRPTTPRVMIAVGLTGALLLLAAILGVGLSDGGLLFAPLLLLFAALVPDAVRALRRRPRLVLSARAVTYHGWSLDSELAWGDISSVAIEGGYRPRLVVNGAHGAASWWVRRHRLILPLERTPGRPEIAVFALSLDEPERLATLLDSFRRHTDAERAHLIAEEGVTYLGGGR